MNTDYSYSNYSKIPIIIVITIIHYFQVIFDVSFDIFDIFEGHKLLGME